MRLARIAAWFCGALALQLMAATLTAIPAAAQDTPGYAGHAACKACHTAIYDSWTQTKHARTIMRLSASEKASECIGCHVTGTKEMIAAEGATPSLPNVQCEACHGAAKAHAADATVRTGLVKKPDAAACERCHNKKSPQFKGFFYNALVGLVHPVKKATD